jgi:ABC-type Mn2+/Zn2+ transport system ATPase subunit
LSTPLVSLRGAVLGYGRRPVLRGIDLDVADGDFLGIVGPNGAGKSTLLKAILGLLTPLAGTVRYGAPRRSLRFGYVPQRETIDTVFPVTALEVVAMGRYPLVGPLGRLGASGRAACLAALDRVGLGGLAGRRFRDLSGGQQQRVLIARALALEPRVLVLDEPTNGMDLESEHALMELVERLHARGGLTVILVSHLLNVVINYAKSLVLLDRERFLSGPVDEVLSRESLRSLYGTDVFLGTLDGRRVVLPCRDRHKAP